MPETEMPMEDASNGQKRKCQWRMPIKMEMPMENASNWQKLKCLTLLHVVDTINWRSMLRMVVLKDIVKSMLRNLKACNGEITKVKRKKRLKRKFKACNGEITKLRYNTIEKHKHAILNCIEKHAIVYIFHGLESEFLKVIFLQLRSM